MHSLWRDRSGRDATSTSQQDALYALMTGILLTVGLYLRTNRYLFNRSLWLDEACLAVNIIERSPEQLLSKLAYGQAAPPGLLLATKALSQAFGYHELVLRFLPYLASLASLFLFLFLAKQYLPRAGILLAVLLFSTSDALGEYAAQFKQYSTDVAVTLVIVLTALWFLRGSGTVRPAAVFAAVGAGAVWFSHPACIILAGVGTVLLLNALHRRHWRSLGLACAIAGVWLTSFSVLFLVSVRDSYRDPYLLRYWGWGFLPLAPTSLSAIERAIVVLVQTFEDPLGLALYSGVFVLFLLGAADALSQGDRGRVLAFPLLVAVALSALRYYPLAKRLILYAVPLLILLTARGWERLLRDLRLNTPYRILFACTLTGLILYTPLRWGLARGINPREYEETRPIMLRLKQMYEEGDTVAVYYGSECAYRYYSHVLGFQAADAITIENHRDDPERYREEVYQLRTHRRVWVIFSHVFSGPRGPEEALILRYMDEIGKQVLDFRERGASLYLYELGSGS